MLVLCFAVLRLELIEKEGIIMKTIFAAAAAFALLFATELRADELASCYDYLMAEDYNSAFAPCSIAAEQGDALAQSNLGLMYEQGLGVVQDYAEAVRWYRAAAEQGNEFAQLDLGWMYENGRGVAQNYAEAARWYRAAAEQGDELAQHNLGRMYYNGLGVAQDDAEALRWFRAAAEQGLAEAQAYVGLFYEFGVGVAQNYIDAHMWFNIAAANGGELAVQSRSRITALMTREQLAEAQQRAQQCMSSNYTDC
jgi:hypothetical protein